MCGEFVLKINARHEAEENKRREAEVEANEMKREKNLKIPLPFRSQKNIRYRNKTNAPLNQKALFLNVYALSILLRLLTPYL